MTIQGVIVAPQLEILKNGGFVDTRRFPIRTVYRNVDLGASVSALMRPLIVAGATTPIVRVDGEDAAKLLTMRAPEHFGGLVSRFFADPRELLRAAQEDPYGVLAAVAWGSKTDQAPRFQANAFRKVLGLLEAIIARGDDYEGEGTFELVLDGYDFPCRVVSVDDSGKFPMGVFPYGGVEVFKFGKLWAITGFSAASQIEDPALAAAAGMFVGSLIYSNTPQGDDPFSYLANLQIEYALEDSAKTPLGRV